MIFTFHRHVQNAFGTKKKHKDVAKNNLGSALLRACIFTRASYCHEGYYVFKVKMHSDMLYMSLQGLSNIHGGVTIITPLLLHPLAF